MTNTRRVNPYYIGLDAIFDKFLHDTGTSYKPVTYPPHDISKISENEYRVDVAVAGFSEDEITIKLENEVLKISGKRNQSSDEVDYLYRGIAKRDFELQFKLYNQYLQVDSATIKDGILSIKFVLIIPEEKLPKLIQIQKQ
jgi:molecular chaperone IbpA